MSVKKYKALPLLIAALTVCENFVANSAALIAEQPQWADPFISNFKKLVENFLTKYFGISSKKELKEATRLVSSIQTQAKDDLSMVRTQIVRNYNGQASRKDAVLDMLGFKAHWKKASNNNQSEIIALLFTFANNLTPELRAELEGKNVNKARLDKIISTKQTLSNANVTQETLKGSSKLDTAEAQAALVNIYNTAMDICEVGKKLFKDDAARKDLFVFSKLVKAQESTGDAPASKSTKQKATPAK